MTALVFFQRFAVDGRAFLRPLRPEDLKGQPSTTCRPGTWIVSIGGRLLLCCQDEEMTGHVVRFVLDHEQVVIRKVHER